MQAKTNIKTAQPKDQTTEDDQPHVIPEEPIQAGTHVLKPEANPEKEATAKKASQKKNVSASSGKQETCTGMAREC